jgi:hypothetical protein
MMVFDADFVGMAALPSERDAILLVDANTMAAGSTILQLGPTTRVEAFGHERAQPSKSAKVTGAPRPWVA